MDYSNTITAGTTVKNIYWSLVWPESESYRCMSMISVQ